VSEEVTVVWVAEGGTTQGARSGAPDGRDDAARALVEWGRARGLRIVSASDATGASTLKVDLSIADRVEKELDRAREAIAALDGDAAERALARAEAVLREHPELPQAAWLRAEVHRSWAARFSRVEPRDDQRALAAWQEADALDGGRAVGIGELAFPPRAHAPVTFTIHGASSRKLVTWLDGVELVPTPSSGGASTDGVTTYALDVAAAEHQVVVSIDGDPVFASWVAIASVTPGTPRPAIPIHVGDDGACSASSLAGVSRDGSTVRATGVACNHWIAASPSERHGSVLVARCERSSCGPFVEWRSEGGLGGGSSVPSTGKHGERWPTWATWTAVGVGVVVATTVALIATGVFESRPTEQRFVAGGVRVE
jgi:hypothetical protein